MDLRKIVCLYIKESERVLTMMIMCMFGNEKMFMIDHVKKPLLEIITVEAHLGVGVLYVHVCMFVCVC